MWYLILRRPLFVIGLAIASVIASNYLGYPLTDILPGRNGDSNRRSDNEVYQGRKPEGCESGRERRYGYQELEALKRHQARERDRYGDSDELRLHQEQEWNELRHRRRQEREKWRDNPQFKPRDVYQDARLYRGDN